MSSSLVKPTIKQLTTSSSWKGSYLLVADQKGVQIHGRRLGLRSHLLLTQSLT